MVFLFFLSFSTDLPTSVAAKLFDVSPSSITHSHSASDDASSTEVYSKYKHGVRRKRTSKATDSVVQEFEKLHCPVKSGLARVLYKQYVTDGQLYNHYCDDSKRIKEEKILAFG